MLVMKNRGGIIICPNVFAIENEVCRKFLHGNTRIDYIFLYDLATEIINK